MSVLAQVRASPLWLLTGCLCSFSAAAAAPDYAQVAPIFKKHCVVCHSGSGAPLELRLDSYPAIRQGSSRGPVVKSGVPQSSELVRRIQGRSQPRMPLTGPPFLSQEEEALVVNWITGGLLEGETGPEESPFPAKQGPPDFSDVAPIFLKRCAKCHKDNGKMGRPPEGLKLTGWKEILRGGERVVVIPGYPDASDLVKKITGTSRPRMPFDGPPYLSEPEIDLISLWIAEGARDARGNKAPIPVGRRVRLQGTLTAYWQLDDLPLIVGPGTRIKKKPRPGDVVEVRGTVLSDGRVQVSRIRRR